MSGLETLIRIEKWRLDEERQRLVGLETEQDALRQQLDAVNEAAKSERRLAASSTDLMFSYDGYARGVRERAADLEHRIGELDGQIDAAAEAVFSAFQELKKLELTKAAQDRREAEAVAKVEQQTLDEIALQGFTGQKDD